MKKITIIGLCLLVASIAHGQVNYPNPVGHVNDFANIIDANTEQGLEVNLRDYREKTSIEIAVATVSSLNGVTVDEYALNLFQKWGVGDKDKDNGILLLVAPNEREMRIEVGYGMEPDLTDIQAGRIIENDMIPYFRDGKMAEGIVAGIAVIIHELGNTPFETRLEERRIAEEKRQADAKRRAEESAAGMKFAGVVLALILLIGTPTTLIFAKIRRKQALKRQYNDNIKTLGRCLVLINKAEANYPDVQKKIEELKKVSLKEIWAGPEKTVIHVPEGIKSARKEIGDLEGLNNKNNWQKSRETFLAISVLLATVTILASLYETISTIISNVQEAKDKSPELLKNTLEDIKAVKENKVLDHKDISDKARQYLQEAENKCGEASTLMKLELKDHSGVVNWFTVYELITGAVVLVAKAKSTASSDKSAAEEARRPKPVYRSSTSSSHRSSSRSSGSSRGGFGGFGGGRSGGGGARGKW